MHPQNLVAEWLAERVAELTAVDPETIPWDAPFLELGLSSTQAVELSDDLQRWSGLVLAPTVVYDYPTINAVAALVALEAQRTGQPVAHLSNRLPAPLDPGQPGRVPS